MAVRQCPFCGRLVTADWQQCPYCREALPPMPVVATPSEQSLTRTKYREGLLCTLLAVIVHYFAGGYSSLPLPLPVLPLVNTYLSPMLFLCGVGLLLYSFVQSHRTAR